MAQNDRVGDLMTAFQKTAYFQWMHRQGIPVVDGYGVQDVREIKMAPWAHLGGKAAFINLYGMEGVTGMYVAEIPPGGALEPEKHFYEKVVCILSGNGATEVWQDGGRKQTFEWGPWSLFAPPMNASHRMVNGGRDPSRSSVLGIRSPLVEGVGDRALPERSRRRGRGSKMEGRQRLLPARRLVPPALQHRAAVGAPSGRALRQPAAPDRLQDRRQAQRRRRLHRREARRHADQL
jgi:hypothetical protein